jgi:flagellar protein FlbD
MIRLSRLNGQVIAVNPDLITWIEVTPDTTLSLLGGDKVMVRESLDDVIERVVAFRREIADRAHPPSKAVLDSAAERKARSSDRAPSHSMPPGSQQRR